VAHLVLVPTPVGNLGDITLRALETLKRADVVAAEDTRHSGRLLAHFEIDRPLVRLDAHTIAARAPRVLDENALVAFVTDAGTPGISDPGAELVTLALERGHTVEVLPGATAFVPALVLSGLPLGRFAFDGFLPRKGRERRERLALIRASDRPVALYEAPNRLLATLRDLHDACGGDRRASVSREISKRFETTYRGTLLELTERLGDADARGEIVIVVDAAPAGSLEAVPDFAERAAELAAEGLRGRDLREALEREGAPRNLAYELALEHGS
jgi:16S rRNA (cytidine1402-2'-O)-methyltransferase